MSDTIKGVKIKALPEKDTMMDTDILVIEDSEATKQISAEAMKTYFTADLAEQIQKLKDENTELSNELYKSVEFYNGDEWLETVVVMRGDDAVYTGNTPKNTDNPERPFLGWNPEPINVKENTKCYAQYSTAFAICCTEDSTLTFYSDVSVPTVGSTYNNKAVSYIYFGFDTEDYPSEYAPWFVDGANNRFNKIIFDKSFVDIQVVSTACWFSQLSNCTSITGFEYLNTSCTTTMSSMFNGCSGLKSLDISGLNTAMVTDFGSVFASCSGLESLDISGLDTSSVTNMNYLFSGCTALKTIYSDDSKFVTTNVTSSYQMFYNNSALVGGNGTSYYSAYTDKKYAHVDVPDNPGYFTAK